MGKAVLAEESLLNYLTNLSKGTTGFIPGLIVGQTVGDNDCVLHLMRTPLHETQDNDSAPVKIGSLAKISKLQESWMADHAKCVTRMLPGGMWVLGLFVIGPDDIFLDAVAQNKLRSTLVQVQKMLSADKFLYGTSPSSEKIVLQFARNSLRYSCKSFDLSNTSSNPKPVEWRFISHPTRWHQLRCHFNLDSVDSIHFTPDSSKQTLQNQFDKVIQAVSDCLDNSIYLISGQMKSDSILLKDFDGSNMDSSKFSESKPGPLLRNGGLILSSPLVDIYQDFGKTTRSKSYNSCKSQELKLTGVLESHIYLHENATIGEGIKILKEDILRSLFSRFEMHYETLIEEEAAVSSDGTIFHEPPRRVMISLYNSDIKFYDYLFPGEGVSEILQSLQEFLDLKVDTSHINKNFEGKAGSLFDSDERLSDLVAHGSKSTQKFNVSSLQIAGLMIVFSGLLIAIIAQLYFKH